MPKFGAEYDCPVCWRRLERLTGKLEDLFCPACRTAVVLFEDQCRYLGPGHGARVRSCSLERIQSRQMARRRTF